MVEQENIMFFRELRLIFHQKRSVNTDFVGFIVIFVAAFINRVIDSVFRRMAQYLSMEE